MGLNQHYQKIWHAVAAIPEGKVVSYGKLADYAGLPGRARLVGRALRQAPAQLRLPWHRVLRSDGHLAFAADSSHAEEQQERLEAEGIPVLRNRVNMSEYGWKPDLAELLWALKG